MYIIIQSGPKRPEW